MGTAEPMVGFAAVSVLTAARDVFGQFKQHPKIGPVLYEKNKRGGFVCFAQAGFGIFSTTLIGTHPITKSTTFNVVGNKARYLLDDPSRVMSREGRDPERELWGGGLRVPNLDAIIAFSGLPEHLDELYVMALAVKLKLMDRDQVIDLLERFPNDYAKPDDGDALFL